MRRHLHTRRLRVHRVRAVARVEAAEFPASTAVFCDTVITQRTRLHLVESNLIQQILRVQRQHRVIVTFKKGIHERRVVVKRSVISET